MTDQPSNRTTSTPIEQTQEQVETDRRPADSARVFGLSKKRRSREDDTDSNSSELKKRRQGSSSPARRVSENEGTQATPMAIIMEEE